MFDFAEFFDNLDGEFFADNAGTAEELGLAADVERIGVADAGVVEAHYIAQAQGKHFAHGEVNLADHGHRVNINAFEFVFKDAEVFGRAGAVRGGKPELGRQFADDRLNGNIGNTKVNHALYFAYFGFEGYEYHHVGRRYDLGELGVGVDLTEPGASIRGLEKNGARLYMLFAPANVLRWSWRLYRRVAVPVTA